MFPIFYAVLSSHPCIPVSQRNVVFFRNQDLTLEEQQLVYTQPRSSSTLEYSRFSLQLGNKLGVLSGRPKESGLHIHPTDNQPDELPAEIHTITSENDRYPCFVSPTVSLY